MRLALISDIHGNLVSLEAVLAEVERNRIDQIVCLGDVAATGPQPGLALERLQALDCPVVMGNTDAWLLEWPVESPKYQGEDGRKFWDIDSWCVGQLTESHRSFIRSFRPTISLELSHGVDLLAYHGSPRSFDDVILPTVSDEALVSFFEGVSPALLAGGHTHLQMARRWQTGFLLNPGSVGLPYVEMTGSGEIRNPPWGEYAVIDVSETGIRVELCRAALDVSAVKTAALESGMPHADWWAADWVQV